MLAGLVSQSIYLLKRFEAQLHTEQMDESVEWAQVRSTHQNLSVFYNALGFAPFIVLAQQAVEENPALDEHDLWVIDEYQDLNAAEDYLVRTLIDDSAGVLLAGDDEQALYQELKASSPEIIIGHYNDASFSKAMLPFCSRCSYHICNAASEFMAKHRTDAAIEKIYLPLQVNEDEPRVRVVATAAPGSAVEYIRAFMDEHADGYAAYLKKRADGKDTDPFLLIVSPSGGLTPKKNDAADTELRVLVAEYAALAVARSKDYARVITYSSAGWYENDNFAVRKLLHEVDLPADDVHEMIKEAIEGQRSLGEVVGGRSDFMERARLVAALLDGSEGDEARVAVKIHEIITLEDADSFADELREHPIGQARVRVDEDEEAIESVAAVDAVALMPITGSKGLSAHHVIVLGCDNVNMGKTSPLAFFVALTRARESLHLIFAAKASGAKSAHPYVLDLPEEYCEYLVFKKDRSVDGLSDQKALNARLAAWASFSKKG